MEGHEWAVKPGWRVVGFLAGYRQILGELVMVNVGGPLVWEGCVCSLGLRGVLVVVVCSGHFLELSRWQFRWRRESYGIR